MGYTDLFSKILIPQFFLVSFGVNMVNIKYFWKIQIFGGAPPFFVLLVILYRNIYVETVKIAYFRDYEPFIRILGPNTRDILSKIFTVKFFVPWSWGLLKGSKMAISGLFLAKMTYLGPILALKTNIRTIFMNYSMGIVP